MLHSRFTFPTLLVLVFTPAAACAQATQSRVADLAFMAGCWRGVTSSGTTIEEFYTTPSSNLVIGTTRYVRDGRTVDFEFTRIDQTDSGAVITPHPKGVRSVSFAPKVLERNRVLWENASHDFPQRIQYARVAGDTLVARIEGRTASGERALEWRMSRAACEAQPRTP